MSNLIVSVDWQIIPESELKGELTDYELAFIKSITKTIKKIDKPASIRCNLNHTRNSLTVTCCTRLGRTISTQTFDMNTGGDLHEREDIDKPRHGRIPKDEEELWENF